MNYKCYVVVNFGFINERGNQVIPSGSLTGYIAEISGNKLTFSAYEKPEESFEFDLTTIDSVEISKKLLKYKAKIVFSSGAILNVTGSKVVIIAIENQKQGLADFMNTLAAFGKDGKTEVYSDEKKKNELYAFLIYKYEDETKKTIMKKGVIELKETCFVFKAFSYEEGKLESPKVFNFSEIESTEYYGGQTTAMVGIKLYSNDLIYVTADKISRVIADFDQKAGIKNFVDKMIEIEIDKERHTK